MRERKRMMGIEKRVMIEWKKELDWEVIEWKKERVSDDRMKLRDGERW